MNDYHFDFDYHLCNKKKVFIFGSNSDSCTAGNLQGCNTNYLFSHVMQNYGYNEVIIHSKLS